MTQFHVRWSGWYYTRCKYHIAPHNGPVIFKFTLVKKPIESLTSKPQQYNEHHTTQLPVQVASDTVMNFHYSFQIMIPMKNWNNCDWNLSFYPFFLSKFVLKFWLHSWVKCCLRRCWCWLNLSIPVRFFDSRYERSSGIQQNSRSNIARLLQVSLYFMALMDCP